MTNRHPNSFSFFWKQFDPDKMRVRTEKAVARRAYNQGWRDAVHMLGTDPDTLLPGAVDHVPLAGKKTPRIVGD